MSPKGGGGASPSLVSASTLNRTPIWLGSASRRRAGGDQFSLLGACRFKKAVAPLGEAEPQKELALGHRAIGPKPERFRFMFQGGEVDMGGEVGLAGQVERVRVAMAAHGLQRIAERRLWHGRNR